MVVVVNGGTNQEKFPNTNITNSQTTGVYATMVVCSKRPTHEHRREILNKPKIIMRVTPESCIIAWFKRKGVVDNHKFISQADKDHDRYTQAESRYRLVGRGGKKRKQ